MNYKEIANMPTSLGRNEISNGARGWHESLLRSYHVAKKVRWLLEQGSSPAVILELMDLMESDQLKESPADVRYAVFLRHVNLGHKSNIENCPACGIEEQIKK